MLSKFLPFNSIMYFSKLPSSVLDIIVSDSTYNDIYISKEDKINAILAFHDIDVNNKNYAGINKLPDSIKRALFPSTNIDGVEISTDDKIDFIVKMAGSDTSSVNEMYKVMENVPSSIQKVIGPKMNMDKIKDMLFYLLVYILLVQYLVILKVYL